MQNKDKMMMSIVQEDGSIDEVEVVIAFELKIRKESMWYILKTNGTKMGILLYMFQE